MSVLIVLLLICGLVLFGIFFLIFKLIWLLLNKKRNFWPLILSAVATLLLLLGTVVVCWSAYQFVVRPLKPIMLAASSRTQPVYGEHVYTDAQHQFQLTLHNGMVMSEWIHGKNGNELLVGMDVNPFVQNKTQEETQNTDNLHALLLLHQTNPKQQDVLKLFQEQLLPDLRQDPRAQQSIQIISGPTPIAIGPDNNAAYVRAIVRSQKAPQGIPVIALAAARGQEIYYVVGIGSRPTEDTVLSFAFN